MPERTGYANGIPSWVDLATPDTSGAKAFYAAVFGWEAMDVPTGVDDGTYTMFTKNGKTVAGMGELSQEQVDAGTPPVWSTYFAVDDADATLEKVTEAGGSVIMPAADVMDTGRLAFFADPTGAAAGIWQAGTHTGSQLVNEHGTVTWNELMTNDIEAAGQFYTDVFGLRIDVFDSPYGPYSTFWADGNLEGHAAAGMMVAPPDMAGSPNYWGVYFAVDDCDAAVETALAHGAKVLTEPFDVPDTGRIAALLDPQGAAFSVMQLANELA